MRTFWLLPLSATALFATGILAQSTPPLNALPSGEWTAIQPNGDTLCSMGTPYEFYVRPADPDKLLLYFQGGGACWNAQTCLGGDTYDGSVEGVEAELGFYDGIFDRDAANNPLADYSTVFVPVCTGDVHTGSTDVEYTQDGVTQTMHFRGYTNASAALDWAYANYSAPENLVVTGSSAGAYGALFHAPYILAEYPDADQVVFGDAGAGVTARNWDGLDVWGATEHTPDDFTDMDFERFTTDYYNRLAAQYPNARFGQYTAANDTVQVFFYTFQGGLPLSWQPEMRANLDAITEDNFTSYIGGGNSHTILPSPLYDTLTVGNTAFADWFSDFINGDLPPRVSCTDCRIAETVEVEE